MMYVHHALMGAESTTGPPVIRTIGVMDLKDALARGMSDFSAMPTHVFFLCLIYPIVGLILARVSFGYDVLSLPGQPIASSSDSASGEISFFTIGSAMPKALAAILCANGLILIPVRRT